MALWRIKRLQTGPSSTGTHDVAYTVTVEDTESTDQATFIHVEAEDVILAPTDWAGILLLAGYTPNDLPAE